MSARTTCLSQLTATSCQRWLKAVDQAEYPVFDKIANRCLLQAGAGGNNCEDSCFCEEELAQLCLAPGKERFEFVAAVADHRGGLGSQHFGRHIGRARDEEALPVGWNCRSVDNRLAKQLRHGIATFLVGSSKRFHGEGRRSRRTSL
jgi:hypothetical protein